MCSAFRACIVVGVICIVLGICFIFIGTFGVKYELPKQKFDFLVIDSENSASYKNWAGGYDEQVEYDMVFYFFNLTNPDDVRMNTAVPVYKQLGPYVYRRYRKAINVTFPDGGNQVSFTDFRQYQFNEEASSGSKHDYIVNLNPVFLSALGQAGSEQQMLGGAVGGYFQNYSKYFTTDFISLYTSYALPGYLHNVSMNQIAVINETLHDTTASTDYFLNAWCNGTTNSTTIGNWAGLLLSDHFGVPTNISKSSASMLLDPSIPYSLLNTATLTAWAWDRSLTNSSYTSLLLQTFDITPVQLEAIWFWRVKAFGPNFIYPGVIEKYNLTEISDLGWAQWNAGYDILGGSIEAPVSIHDLYPTEQIGYYTTVELFLYPSDPPVFEWQNLKQVMDPVTGLCNMVIFQEFALAMSNQTASTNFSQWGVNQDQAEQLYTYMFVAGVNQVVPALLAEYGDGGGLVLKQTVDDWVFNCNYFLINLLLPVPAPCSLLLNNTVFSTVTINSGKSDISKINEYIEWNGSPTVKGLWAQDIPVKGSTELGQFPPNENKATVLQTFNDEFVRTMTLTYNSSSAIRKIDTNQFTLNYNDIFAPNPLYFQTIPGFANLTSLKQAPIYYSLWDMLYVNESYRQSVVGLNNSTESDSSTSVDVEPITGNTLRVRKRLQANMFTPPGCTWCNNPISYLGNTGFQANTFYPFVKAGEYSEITEDLASSVRVKIEALKYGTRYGMIVGLTVGIFLFVLGIILVFYGNVKRRQDYSRIRDFR